MEFLILKSILPLHFALNFPPKIRNFSDSNILDVKVGVVVVGVGVVVTVGHGDNSGTSFNWHFTIKPISCRYHDNEGWLENKQTNRRIKYYQK